MGDRLLTVLETAQQFNLTTGLLYTAIAKGELAAVRFRPRGRIRVREADVRDWIESHASGADVRTQRQTGLADAVVSGSVEHRAASAAEGVSAVCVMKETVAVAQVSS